MKRKIIKILVVILFNLFLTLLLIEITLRIAGNIYFKYRLNESNSHIKKYNNDAVRILCLGDSFTFGMGAQKGYSYPEQLERILSNRNPGRRFIVYNYGLPGNTSAKLLNKQLKQYLLEFQPQIVIILIGQNDPLIIHESDFWLVKNNNLESRLFPNLSDLRCYKLIMTIINSIEATRMQEKLFSKFKKADFLPKEGCARIKSRFVRDPEMKYNSYDTYMERADKYWNNYNRNFTLATQTLKEAIVVEPCKIDSYLKLGTLYMVMEKYDLAIENMKYALLLEPSNKNIYLNLFAAFYRAGNTIAAQEALEKYLYLTPGEMPTYLMLLKNKFPNINDKDLFSNLYMLNLRKIIKECKKQKVTVILQNYPHLYNYPPLAKDIALAEKIPFVDNGMSYLKLHQRSDYKQEYYFVKDGHCNEQGYKIMANNIYNIIKEERILPLD